MARQTNGTNQSLQSAAALSTLSGTSRIAISLWLNTTFATDDDIIFELSDNSNTNGGSFKLIANESNSNSFFFDMFSTSGSKTGFSVIPPTGSTWHHILINCNLANSSSTEVESWYVDGIAQTLTQRTFGENTGTFGSYVLNVMSRANASLFADGAVTDLCIWAPSSAISSTDAATLAGGIRANAIRNSEIAYYWPLGGTTSPEPASIGGVDLTVNGATTATDPRELTHAPTSWISRTVLSGSSIAANGTSSHTCTFTTASAGNLLVAVMGGGVTFTTPTGWTLVTSAVNSGGLYVFTKTASGSESSFSTTHNASDAAIKGVVYEFFAGSAVLGTAGSQINIDPNAVRTGPDTTGLSGTYTRFAARTQIVTSADNVPSTAWTVPSVKDYDAYVPQGSATGISLTIAFDDGVTGSSFTPSANTTSSIGTGLEGVSFAVSVVSPPTGARVVQYKTASTNSASSLSVTLDAAPTEGNIVCVIVNSDATITGPTGYTSRGSNVGNQAVYVWDKTADASESATITVTPSASDTVVMIAIEVGGTSGFDTISTVASTQGSGSQTSRTISSLTTVAGAGDLVIAAALLHSFSSGPTSPNWDNSFTALATAGPTTNGTSGKECAAFFSTRSVAASTAVGTTTCSWTNILSDTMGWHIAYASATSPLTPIPWLRF